MANPAASLARAEAVVLAAGKGTRMNSNRPKVLQQICGKTMVEWQLGALRACAVSSVHLVVGHKAVEIESYVRRFQPWVNCIRQSQQLGTGHAAKIGLPSNPDNRPVLVLAGDIPFVNPDTLSRLLSIAARGSLALLTTRLDNPTGYGRVLRLSGAIEAIVEERDAEPQTKAINEVFCGVLAAPANRLYSWLGQLDNHNAQHEYYLPEVVSMARRSASRVECVEIADQLEVFGVNSLSQLIELEQRWMARQIARLIDQGVYIAAPQRTELRGELVCGRDVRIDPNCLFQGRVELEDGVHIGANSVLISCHVGAGSRVEPFCHIANSWVGEQCEIGPYARLRKNTRLAHNSRVGNFVEIKNSSFGHGSKASHLAYLGDSQIGADVNIGAGTITCNYDGRNKHQTIIGNGVFVGSNASLVAPLKIGANAIIGAGSVITDDVPKTCLALARSHQLNKQRRS